MACLYAEAAGIASFPASATYWALNLGYVRKSRIHGVEPRALVLMTHFHGVNFFAVEWGWEDRDTGHAAHLLHVYSVLGQLSPTKMSQFVLPGSFQFPLYIYLLYAALDPSRDLWGETCFIHTSNNIFDYPCFGGEVINFITSSLPQLITHIL